MPISSSRNPVSHQEYHNSSLEWTSERKGKLNLDDQKYFEQLFRNGGGNGNFEKHHYSKNYPRKNKQNNQNKRLQRLHVDSTVAPTPRYNMPFNFVRFQTRMSETQSDGEYEYVDREPHIFSIEKSSEKKEDKNEIVDDMPSSREKLYIQDYDLVENRYGTCFCCYRWWHIFLWGILGGLGLAALITGIVYAKLSKIEKIFSHFSSKSCFCLTFCI